MEVKNTNVKNRLPHFYHVEPQSIQVLTPMQRGVVGTANLNQMLQASVDTGNVMGTMEREHPGCSILQNR